jgi:tetratricopeptide (TPR) repeat protein
MSYIHEALKKAQKHRDAHYAEYNRILSGRGKTRRAFVGGKLWWACLSFFIIIFIAFVSYSWLDFRTVQNPATPELSHEKRVEIPKAGNVSNAEELCERGGVFYKAGRLKDARRLYEETLSIAPDYVEALNNLGVIYIHDKDYPAARSSFEKAIRLRPGYVDPYYNLACLYAIKGEVSEGLAYLEKAVSLDKSVRGWARNDADLEAIRGTPEFEEIMTD